MSCDADEAGGSIYWRAIKVDGRGQLTEEVFGNGVSTSRSYNGRSAKLETMTTLGVSAQLIQDIQYEYDARGDLRERIDYMLPGPVSGHRHERFTHDPLHRLETVERYVEGKAWVTELGLTYDSIGNIKSKSDVGTYEYNSNRPHAVTQIIDSSTSDSSYLYDANGNLEENNTHAFQYTAFNKPRLASPKTPSIGDVAVFKYSAGHQRIAKVTEKYTRLYLGGLANVELERSGENSQLKSFRYYIRAGDRVIAEIAREVTPTDPTGYDTNTLYLHNDYLSSIQAITNSDGDLFKRYDYDAFGKLINEEVLSPDARDLRFGYTGHEHDNDLGLINMKGRIYDPTLARFLSPDPFVQAPHFSQSLNRYSYVWNNPLSLMDPSGFTAEPPPPPPPSVRDKSKKRDKAWAAAQQLGSTDILGSGAGVTYSPGIDDGTGSSDTNSQSQNQSKTDESIGLLGAFKNGMDKAAELQHEEAFSPVLDAMSQIAGTLNGLGIPGFEKPLEGFEASYRRGQVWGTIIRMAGGAAMVIGGLSGGALSIGGAPVTGGVSATLSPAAAAAIAAGVVISAQASADLISLLSNATTGGGSSSSRDKGLPRKPDDLTKQGYKETSHPEAAKKGHRTFENTKTGDKLRFDKGKPGANGFEGKDHYHRYNPDATSKYNQYLDRNGNPVGRGSDASHILAGD